jgi:hypothetical protein
VLTFEKDLAGEHTASLAHKSVLFSVGLYAGSMVHGPRA